MVPAAEEEEYKLLGLRVIECSGEEDYPAGHEIP